MEKLASSWQLMKASWAILKADREILLFPVISGVALILVVASFIAPIIALGISGRSLLSEGSLAVNSVILFLFYFICYFVIIFFNCAIIVCATLRMNGGDPTVSDGLRAAFSFISEIAGWALVSATVGLILRSIAERSRLLGRIVAGLLGMAWSVTSFLVIPVLVNEGKGPVEAYKRSVHLLKKTWGEELIGTFSFGLVFGVLSLPAAAFYVFSVISGKGALALVLMVLSALYLIILSVFQSALQGIFQAALYHYARSGEAPAGFDGEVLRDAIQPRYFG
ncbi:MAG TPA: DUF6159 family protein [Syntrophales bacterium]|nr:DUF6159 family protein [Syntrophales bacterium]HOX94807.1 DUF6159 family protein [Syntrophales bacterium]HPI57957.1 DUF6159 family protein [Syntrophales bacterium]HPN24564.1 DUF6159 family protein [Syntrophales bacterium]HQM28870.1 DUF6159 family protein [Syntrophales bacterium]